MRSPVVSLMYPSMPAARRRSHSGAVRRHCHTMALHTGMPVTASQATVVSRWLVMEMAAMSRARMPACSTAWRMAYSVVCRICTASCST